MYKPNNLRDYLRKAIKELAQNPDKLHIFIDEGGTRATGTAGLSFQYEYVLNLILTDFGLDLDVVFVPLLAWMRVHQREAFANPENAKKAVRFEVDMNSAQSLDLSIKLTLTERTIVKRQDGGRLQIDHAAEPQLTPPFADDFWQLYRGDSLLAEWDVPKLP
ncbi:phage tail protein [Herbaspirillum rubrisubalbicans]|uniref:Tail protein n=1 Tax=Herbaspirillum rubrisubalbicans TaxID=80842 RepID=A0ABX9BU07_9BURK|nr:phage tail protein [Herbaspirillum rubrisubalbicans]RAM61172.1 tail protein [Herbaspirillum rubrisubalbicans]